MICIIFTRTKLLAGAKLKSSELLPIEGKYAVNYGSRTMAETLSSNLKMVVGAYESYLKKNQVQMPKTIPAAIAFPPELASDPQGKKKIDDVIRVLTQSAIKLEIVHTDDLGHAYLQGLKMDEKTLAGPCLMLDALDDNVNVYYQKGESDILNGNGKVLEFIPMNDLGDRWGEENLINELMGEFRNAGLAVNEKDKTDLATQVKQKLKEHKYTLTRSSGAVSIQAEVALPENRYKDVVTSNRIKLKDRLSAASLDEKGVQKVVLMGEYLHNEVMRDYLDKDLQLAKRIVTAKSNGALSEYSTILEGLMERTNIAIEAKAEIERKRREEEEKRKKEEEQRRIEAENLRRKEEERKRKEEEEKRKQEEERKRIEAERMAQIARNKMLEEIQTVCKVAAKAKEYENRFVPQGIKLGMPKEVIVWNISEAIKRSTLLPDMKPVSLVVTPAATAPAGNDAVKVQQATAQEGINKTVAPEPEKEQVPELPGITDLFEVKGVLLDVEFTTKKVLPMGEKTMKVLKLLSAEDAKIPVRWEAFQQLYKKELTYYGELSEIETAAEGKYYSRNYLERNTLKDYVKRSGMADKDSFTDLSSSDLKFILEVFKEVENLNVTHADLNENNILVISKRKWNLQREAEIKFAGFTSKDCAPEEMIARLHEIWGKLLGEKVYKEFREKLNM